MSSLCLMMWGDTDVDIVSAVISLSALLFLSVFISLSLLLHHLSHLSLLLTEAGLGCVLIGMIAVWFVVILFASFLSISPPFYPFPSPSLYLPLDELYYPQPNHLHLTCSSAIPSLPLSVILTLHSPFCFTSGEFPNMHCLTYAVASVALWSYINIPTCFSKIKNWGGNPIGEQKL